MLTKGKVLIAGGSGFIGTQLAKLLIKHHYEVAILTRNKSTHAEYEHYQWDINSQYIQKNALNGVDYIINLAGKNIAEGRWNKKQKREIQESRIKSTTLLFDAAQKESRPLAYIAASAVGYYGNITSEKIFEEFDISGNDFLASVCQKWEKASLEFENIGIRTVILRTGVVFDKKLGAFPKMTQSLKFGFISGVGSGKQYIPWIHIDDLTRIYLWAIENNKTKGIYNAIAPDHINQKDLIQQISKITGKHKAPRLPGIFLKLIWGKMSSIVLEGSRISAQKIVEEGFKFKHYNIQDSLKDLL